MHNVHNKETRAMAADTTKAMHATPSTNPARLAILYPGDRATRDRADPRESRFAALFDAFAAAGVATEPAVYHDDFIDDVRAQLLKVRGVLVWHNPIEGGRTRAVLDAMLCEVAARGVCVGTHPDTILRLGTKDVLLAVRDLPFGSDAVRVDSVDQLRRELPQRLARGARVLKQHRGHSGIGVWRIEATPDGRFALRHAQRGAAEEVVDFDTVAQRLAPYFDNSGHMIDQAWQPRLAEGMVRAYLVRGRVGGFGHQAINALVPAPSGEAAPASSARLYSGPDDPRFQDLRRRLEGGWIDQLRAQTAMPSNELPMLWDMDFMLGERAAGEPERYVLCEINVSSVSPFPESAIEPLVQASIEAWVLQST
jgi:hypothetical protein